MKSHHISALAALGAATMVLGSLPAAGAEDPNSVSANIGAVSNYIWRGQTQTGNQPAIQGGFDYAHTSGFSAGTWVSNVDFQDAAGNDTNYEWDLYAGFGRSINDDLSYKLNLLYYAYPDGRDLDFSEIDASATYKWLTTGISYTFYGQADQAKGVFDNQALYIQGDVYYHASLNFELPYKVGLTLRGGYYDFRYNDGGNDYGHVGAALSRAAGDFGTFSLNYDQVLRDNYDEDPKLWVGWNKSF